MDWNNVVSMVATEEGLLCTVRGADGVLGSEPVLVPYKDGMLSGTCCWMVNLWDGKSITVLPNWCGEDVSSTMKNIWHQHFSTNAVGKKRVYVATASVPPSSGGFFAPAPEKCVKEPGNYYDGLKFGNDPNFIPEQNIKTNTPIHGGQQTNIDTSATPIRTGHFGPTPTGVMPQQCPNGYHWDYQQRRCVQTSPFRVGPNDIIAR